MPTEALKQTAKPFDHLSMENWDRVTSPRALILSRVLPHRAVGFQELIATLQDDKLSIFEGSGLLQAE